MKSPIYLLISAAVFFSMQGYPVFAQVPKGDWNLEQNLDFFKKWRAAVSRHEPGKVDAPLQEIACWPESSMRAVLETAKVAGSFYRSGGKNESPEDAERRLKEINKMTILPGIYELNGEARRMDKLLAWFTLNPDLVKFILNLTEDEWYRRDASRIALQGAILHADIAMADESRLSCSESITWHESIDDESHYYLKDGIHRGNRKMRQWHYARRVIDFLHNNPSSDDRIRRWYIATSSFMEQSTSWGAANIHLKRALEIFHQDANLYLLRGALHEIRASPRAQNAIPPSNRRFNIESEKEELQTALQYFQIILELYGHFKPAHLHLGRVMGLLGNHKEAAAELMKAEETDPTLQYYQALFLGAELEAMEELEGARKQYEKAVHLFPTAQSPWLAISSLARSRGDAREALAALEKAIALQKEEDPWWTYNISHVKDANSLLSEIREEIGKLPR